MDQNAPPPSPIPAPYGHACVNCARAKCKCILLSLDGKCERLDFVIENFLYESIHYGMYIMR